MRKLTFHTVSVCANDREFEMLTSLVYRPLCLQCLSKLVYDLPVGKCRTNRSLERCAIFMESEVRVLVK